jgi:hypothetical protein
MLLSLSLVCFSGSGVDQNLSSPAQVHTHTAPNLSFQEPVPWSGTVLSSDHYVIITYLKNILLLKSYPKHELVLLGIALSTEHK